MCAEPISAGEEALAPDLSGDELAWEALSREALVAHGSCRRNEAAVLWHRAAALSAGFPPGDPRRATSISNQALAWALSDAIDRAEAGFRAATDAWETSRRWSAKMVVHGTARSSLFHHRLEVKHRDSFKAHLRARYRGWIDAGEAASAFNRGIVLICLDRDEAGRAELAEAAILREKAFGAAEPGLALMLRTLATLGGPDADAYRERAMIAESDPSRDALARWMQGRSPHLDDVRRLLGAVCLTAIFDERDFL